MGKAENLADSKLSTTCQSQFFDFTKLLSSLQTQVIRFLAFELFPSIAEAEGFEWKRTYIPYCMRLHVSESKACRFQNYDI